MDVLPIAFDRGTLRIDGPRELAAALPCGVWDERTSTIRAPAYRYTEVLERAGTIGLQIKDAIAPAFRRELGVRHPTLRDYQADALASWRAHRGRGLVVLPTGAGKTRLAVAAMATIRRPTLVLCPTRALLEHWEHELTHWYDGAVGVVGDGVARVEDLTVMTFESAYRRLDDLGDRFALLVVDEVHHFGSGLRAEALEMCPAPRRLGLTATAPALGTAALDRLVDLVGPIVCEIGVSELVGTHLAPVDFVRISVRLNEGEQRAYDADQEPYRMLRATLRRANPAADPATITRLLLRSESGRRALAGHERAVRLASFCVAKRRMTETLLARHRDDQALVFTALAQDAYELSRQTLLPVVTADIARAERAEILARFRDRHYRAILSARVLNEGVDVPDANVAIVLGGRLGLREHVQRIGRVLRPVHGKRAVVYDIVTAATMDDQRAAARSRRLALHR